MELLQACATGRLEDVKKFYAKTSESTEKHNNHSIDNSPLHEACRHGHLEIVKYLINEQMLDIGTIIYYKGHFSNPNKKLKETILLAACQSGNIELLKFLIELPTISILCTTFETMSRRGFHYSELHMACFYNRLEAVKFLLDNGIATGSEISFGEKNTPFYIACEQGHYELVEYLLNRPSPVSVNCKATKRQHAFGAACYGGHLNLVKYFLEHPNFKKMYDLNRNAVHAACEGGRLEVIEELMKYPELIVPDDFSALGVWKLNTGDVGNETTPIAVAIKHSNADIINLLLRSQVHVPGAVHEAASNRKIQLAKMIIENPNVQLRGHETQLLQIFAQYASLEDFQNLFSQLGNDPAFITHDVVVVATLPILVYLITNFPHIDVNQRHGRERSTLLDDACQAAHYAKIKFLLGLPQIDPSIGSPICKAIGSDSPRNPQVLDIIRLITAHPKSNPNVELLIANQFGEETKRYQYPFQLACKNRSGKIALYLSTIIDPNGPESTQVDGQLLPLAWVCLASREQASFWLQTLPTEELVENLLSSGADDSLLPEAISKDFEELITEAKLKIMANQKFCY